MYLEIVFIPYKASHWGSFESIWKVAMEDEDCDVYVILISYFVQNADATVKEVYYEGEQFPEYVKVPGIVHADKVIVQSENMRQIYSVKERVRNVSAMFV